MKILMVDDDIRWSRLVSTILESEGDEVTVVEDSASATELLQKNEKTYDHVLYDGLNGDWKFVRESATQRGIPNTLLSGDRDILEVAKKEGVIYFSKNTTEERGFSGRVLREHLHPPKSAREIV